MTATTPTTATAAQAVPSEPGAQDFGWLLDRFVDETLGVVDAVGVSSDGLLLARSSGLTRPVAEQLAAIVSGLVGLGKGTARCIGATRLNQVIIETDAGFFFVSAIADGSVLGVLATRHCDLGLVGYEMTVLTERAGSMLTPEVVSELKRTVTE
jgi:predicted regulator of Ras-like GTPase activity (Roadblock/LC7/MglB family)